MRIDESRPIWGQLVDEFQRRITSGEWPVGAKIPSVRELALEIGVNPNTVQKALGEVDRLGLTVTERTAGRFVTADERAIDAARTRLAGDAAEYFAAAIIGLGMSLGTAQDLLAEHWNRKNRTSREDG
ncbi:MAG: GntR family transcriptional regulator [Actinobacteria bacterium]|nr:GntR family transcriptional regulator [Actinomycetota bacterium]